ncbi:hypothetical protein SAE02_58210 [Skermanella aerolata]|uniref:Uncharacterized protein n=2 Tax=Skermanella aerolata TaxID=393310 RepID=A0A512DYU5_9PROT|nr:hypothetical protein SAE02_58210 [Skermanella aerolata]
MSPQGFKCKFKDNLDMSQPLCFVIGPIGEEGSDFRQHADDLFDLIIKPVVESTEFGYRADRADKIRKPGHITNQIIKMIKEADLVVADLSHRNPNDSMNWH